MKQDLVSQLLAAIFDGRLTSGQRLIEQNLAVQFGVSRTPVREALSQLAASGLIELQPNRGAVVKSFGPTELGDIYEFRQILESQATRLACERIDRDELVAMHAVTLALQKRRSRGAAWSRRAIEIDEQFHGMIATASGNQRLQEEIGRYRKLVGVIRHTVANRAGYQEQAISQHLAIFDALINHDADHAAMCMHDHIAHAAKVAQLVVFPKRSKRKKLTGHISSAP